MIVHWIFLLVLVQPFQMQPDKLQVLSHSRMCTGIKQLIFQSRIEKYVCAWIFCIWQRDRPTPHNIIVCVRIRESQHRSKKLLSTQEIRRKRKHSTKKHIHNYFSKPNVDFTLEKTVQIKMVFINCENENVLRTFLPSSNRNRALKLNKPGKTAWLDCCNQRRFCNPDNNAIP